MIQVIRCHWCGEMATMYSVSIPKEDRKECPCCGHSYDSYKRTFDFCGSECMIKWVESYKRNHSSASTTKEEER